MFTCYSLSFIYKSKIEKTFSHAFYISYKIKLQKKKQKLFQKAKMGLTKQYLRYSPANIFGIIAGTRCNIKQIKYKGVTGKYAAVGACEFVLIWDLKKGETVNNCKKLLNFK